MEQVKAEPVALKPVDQTVLGIGNPRANCFQACLAMVTGLPIGQCVDITDPEIEDGQWIAPVEAWAAKHGLRFVTGIKAPMDRPYIANGPTAEREGVHGVVCVGHELFHDPHPSRAGIVSVNWYGWFVPLYANPQPAAVDGVVELVSDMMREVFISGADWGRTRPGHFSDYLADAIKPHLEALTKTKQP